MLDSKWSEEAYKAKDKTPIYVKRAIIAFVITCILAVALYLIYFTVVKYSSETGTVAGLIPSIVLAAFNVGLPPFFQGLSSVTCK